MGAKEHILCEYVQIPIVKKPRVKVSRVEKVIKQDGLIEDLVTDKTLGLKNG